jgi:hypothetical protein
MATKHEEANIAPVDNAGLVEGASAEKQSDTAPAVGADKQVDNATDAVNNLALADKETKEEGEKGDVDEVAAPLASGTATDPASAPVAETVQPTTGPFWPETDPDHPLTKFYDVFEELVKEAQHDEVYGVHLSKSQPFHTKLILQKEFDPVKAIGETFDKTKFGGLGYVLEVEGVPESKNAKDIATFNIYGAVKDKKATFGDLEK